MLPIFAYLIKIKMTNVETNQFNNFLSKNKCQKIIGGKYDNGRIIKAKELETVITDVDYQYIKKSYSFDYEVQEIYCAIYDYLPKQFIKFVLEKYVEKTKLKNVEGQEYAYSRSKALFNALYGMAVTNNIRDEVEFDNVTGWKEIPLTNEQILEKLKKEKKAGFLSFAWGVWCTAYARDNLLRRVIELDPYTVYMDTDSIKLVQGYDKTVFEKYNKSVEEKIKHVCKVRGIEFERYAPSDIKGIPHLLGVFECETGKGRSVTYDKFITQGAKKYAYEIDGEIHVTVSGVPKSGGAKCLKSLEEFRDDLIFDFENTNKLTLFYNDNQEEFEITDYLGNSCTVKDKSGICMIPTTYKLGKALDYIELITEQSSERAKFR